MERWVRSKLEQCQDEMVCEWERYAQMAGSIGCEKAYIRCCIGECKAKWETLLSDVPTQVNVVSTAVPEERFENLQKLCAKLRERVRSQNEMAYQVLEVLKGKYQRQETTLDYIHNTLQREALLLREQLFRSRNRGEETEFTPQDFSLADFMRFAENNVLETAKAMSDFLQDRRVFDTDLELTFETEGHRGKDAEWKNHLEVEREAHSKEMKTALYHIETLKTKLSIRASEVASMRSVHEAGVRRLTDQIEELAAANEELELRLRRGGGGGGGGGSGEAGIGDPLSMQALKRRHETHGSVARRRASSLGARSVGRASSASSLPGDGTPPAPDTPTNAVEGLQAKVAELRNEKEKDSLMAQIRLQNLSLKSQTVFREYEAKRKKEVTDMLNSNNELYKKCCKLQNELGECQQKLSTVGLEAEVRTRKECAALFTAEREKHADDATALKALESKLEDLIVDRDHHKDLHAAAEANTHALREELDAVQRRAAEDRDAWEQERLQAAKTRAAASALARGGNKGSNALRRETSVAPGKAPALAAAGAASAPAAAAAAAAPPEAVARLREEVERLEARAAADAKEAAEERRRTAREAEAAAEAARVEALRAEAQAEKLRQDDMLAIKAGDGRRRELQQEVARLRTQVARLDDARDEAVERSTGQAEEVALLTRQLDQMLEASEASTQANRLRNTLFTSQKLETLLSAVQMGLSGRGGGEGGGAGQKEGGEEDDAASLIDEVRRMEEEREVAERRADVEKSVRAATAHVQEERCVELQENVRQLEQQLARLAAAAKEGAPVGQRSAVIVLSKGVNTDAASGVGGGGGGGGEMVVVSTTAATDAEQRCAIMGSMLLQAEDENRARTTEAAALGRQVASARRAGGEAYAVAEAQLEATEAAVRAMVAVEERLAVQEVDAVYKYLLEKVLDMKGGVRMRRQPVSRGEVGEGGDGEGEGGEGGGKTQGARGLLASAVDLWNQKSAVSRMTPLADLYFEVQDRGVQTLLVGKDHGKRGSAFSASQAASGTFDPGYVFRSGSEGDASALQKEHSLAHRRASTAAPERKPVSPSPPTPAAPPQDDAPSPSPPSAGEGGGGADDGVASSKNGAAPQPQNGRRRSSASHARVAVRSAFGDVPEQHGSVVITSIVNRRGSNAGAGAASARRRSSVAFVPHPPTSSMLEFSSSGQVSLDEVPEAQHTKPRPVTNAPMGPLKHASKKRDHFHPRTTEAQEEWVHEEYVREV